MLTKIRRYRFLFSELIKRDFKKKYKRTVLGMLWSLLSPLMMLLVMALVFTKFFGRSTEHYVVYLFAGIVNFNYFSDGTTGGMQSLMANAGIFSHVNVPKYLFLLSRNVQAAINYLLTLLVFFVFVAAEGIAFRWNFLLLIYPAACLTLLNIGVGMILSALYMMFKDIQYLYAVFTQLLMYFSAIFYNINAFALKIQYLFYLNPVYVYIRYFRKIVIDNDIPQLSFHALCLGYPVILLAIGCFIYRKYNYKFIYYV